MALNLRRNISAPELRIHKLRYYDFPVHFYLCSIIKNKIEIEDKWLNMSPVKKGPLVSIFNKLFKNLFRIKPKI